MHSLTEYDRKRDFTKTKEPKGRKLKSKKKLKFVIQEHHASHLHYDFRLEFAGVLKSWAVPKGPSLDPKTKRMAVQVEDHPIAYGKFEGTIPKGEYGGGEVYIWDEGTWEPGEDVAAGLKKGHLDFTLHGKRLHGKWVLVRTGGWGKSGGASRKAHWLLIKRDDEFASAGDVAEQIGTPAALKGKPVWHSKRKTSPKFSVLDNKSKKKARRSSGQSRWEEESEAPPLRDAEEDKETLSEAIASLKAKRPKRKSKTKKKTAKKSKAKVRKADAMEDFVRPQLALLVDAPPEGDEWIHETKFDGYRTQAHVENGEVRLRTRAGHDWTESYTPIAKALKDLKIQNAILDGEIVALDQKGRSDFQVLQNVLKEDRQAQLRFYVFDLLHLNGHDLRGLSLKDRKELLQELLKTRKKDPLLIFSDHQSGNADVLLKKACKLGIEGIVSKRLDAPYTSGRTDSWVKAKCKNRQEFVIGGWSKGTGTRVGFGALLLGVYEDGKFRYSGRVGTGFNQKSLLDIRKRLAANEIDESPFEIASPKERGLRWVKPKLVAEVAFANWTTDDVLRVPVFQGLREDKNPKQIVREEKVQAQEEPRKKAAKSKSRPVKTSSKIPITHPDKIIFPQEEITKMQVAQYYQIVARWILPHISDRPLSLLRCPNGVEGECFFQKHFPDQPSDFLEPVRIKEKSTTREYITLDSKQGLTSLVQMGASELHTWNCRRDDVDHPDQIVMDFDPDPSVKWPKVIDAAFELKEMLDQLKLKSFVKVTGGKGLHVHVPFQPLYTWDQVKEFAQSLAQEMVSRNPKQYIATMSKKERVGKIFVDYLRNGRSATAIVPYSLRAREISSVALPVDWKDLKKLKASSFYTMSESLEFLAKRKKDPWADYFKAAKQKISIL